jgi:hypothetical protein
MRQSRLLILVSQWVLLSPLALFLAAIAAHRLPLLAEACARIIGWFVTRFWSLWVLLLAVPLLALLLGVTALLAARDPRDALSPGTGRSSAAVGGTVSLGAVAATTGVGAALLAVIVLHMLAN